MAVLVVKRIIPSFIDVIMSVGPRVKFKLLLTFHQEIVCLRDEYGVAISSKLKYWMNVLKWLSVVDFLQVARVPLECILGSTLQRLIVSTLWPFTLNMLCVSILLAFRPYKRQDDYYFALVSNFLIDLLFCCWYDIEALL